VITALRERFPNIHGPRKEDICYATQNRQDAVKKLSAECDLILVVGSRNSSNSTRLMEIPLKKAIPSYLIDGASDIRDEWLQGKTSIGVTAGASAPEVLVQEVVQRLQDLTNARVVEFQGVQENVVFSLPRELKLSRNPASVTK
ncbi:MAG: 4-hydroxy-3-methylbut-2-enyl diphosphate reductase, partial [Gammaproteobacteria bacterium]